MVYLGPGVQYVAESGRAFISPNNPQDVLMDNKKMLMMQKRDVILTAVFSSLAAIILIAGISAACYFFHKRRRKRDEEEEDSQEVTYCRKVEEVQEKKSRLNGFLTLKTPLISTKTLGYL
ncbi:uncharacterized protein LOC130902471 [Diorhabda carinulata]|uniref:uncharacterized protein LOC130902471 n=1 Tax=Diorhabda carinulata TaxID=1163345 RepID=UPI0025A1E80A|nr:uncharacterized protein LOC130902471 [Diorhabda carinulata]